MRTETTNPVTINPKSDRDAQARTLGTTMVPGQRLQVVCRKLGLDYKTFGKWVPNSNRRYPDRFRVLGVTLEESNAKKLSAYLAARKAKEKAKWEKRKEWQAEAERLAGPPVAWPDSALKKTDPTAYENQYRAAADRQAEYYKHLGLLDGSTNRAIARAKREEKEIAVIAGVVNAHWTLDPADVEAFAKHANESGEGRVVRTRAACAEPFEEKVRMALVAWVRHNKTDYDSAFSKARDAAYEQYAAAKEFGYDRADRLDALDNARAESAQAHAELKAQYTEEALAWLKSRERIAQQVA